MATQKEDVILKFEVEQGDALTELERTKKSILGIKQEQQELNKAYKQGNITLDEYVQDSVRLEGILKKQQSSYNTLQKSVTGVKTQLDKLIDSNKEIAQDLKKTSATMQKFGTDFITASKSVNVAGVSIGDVTTKIASFLNPATAAVGVVTALVGAYATSTAGSKDLQLATDQLSAAFALARDNYGAFVEELVTGESGRGGKGIFERLSEGFTRTIFGDKVYNKSTLIKLALEDLRKFNREMNDALRASKAFEKASEDARRVRDDDQASIEQRVKAVQAVEDNLKASEQVRVTALRKQIDLVREASVEFQTYGYLYNDTQTLDEISKIAAEIADIEESVNGKLTENIAARRQILALANDLKESTKTAGGASTNNNTKAVKSSVANVTTPSDVQAANVQVGNQQYLNNALKTLEQQRTEDANAAAAERFENQQAWDAATYESAVVSSMLINDALAGLFKEGSDAQKFFAFSSILVSTADAIAKATAAASGVPFPGNIAAIATSVATVLGNIANAKDIFSQAAGGGDFITRGPSLLMVGDNPGGVERVTVEPISGKGQTKVYGPNLVAMAGGGSITTNPGGLISNSLTADVNTQLMMANMFKQMPTPSIGIEQFNRASKLLTTKQNAVRI
jgi:uncharacterized protein YoxC